MRDWRSWAAPVLALALLLSGCGGDAEGLTPFDARTYVDGLLKENYLGQFEEDYMDLVGIDEEEAQATYESSIDAEVNFFLDMYGVEYPDDDLYDELTEFYKEIYSHTRYEIVDAVEMSDGSFAVKLNVEPIDIVQLADTDWDKTITPFYEKYPQDAQDAMSQEEYEALNRKYARLVVDLYQDKLEECGNMTARSITVQLEKDEDGYYSINEDDFGKLDELIIDYTDNVGVSI